MLADPAGMFEQFGRIGIFLGRDIARLFEQRHVDIGFDVALGAGIAVPVPGAAEIAGLFDDANVGDADLVQFRRREKATETATYHERSEEHTSELQSLMRISYAVFCSKKNKTYTDE